MKRLRSPLVILAAGVLGLSLGQFAGQSAVGQERDPHSHAEQDPGRAQARTFAWDKETLALAATLPIQEDGRVKPLYTLASFQLLRINGKRKCFTGPDDTGEKLKPTAWILDTIFFPDTAKTYEVFLVRDKKVVEAMGLSFPKKRKTDRYSYQELAPGKAKLIELFRSIRMIEAKERDSQQHQLFDLAQNLTSYERLIEFLEFARRPMHTSDSARLKEIFGEESPSFVEVTSQGHRLKRAFDMIAKDPNLTPEQKSAERQAFAHLEQDALGVAQKGAAIDMFPPSEPPTSEIGKEWLSPGELFLASSRTNRSVGKQVRLLGQLEQLEGAKGDPVAFKSSLEALHRGLAEMAEARDEYHKVPIEVSYYKRDFFTNALVFYMLGFLLLAVTWLLPKESNGVKWIKRIVWGALILATFLAVLGITYRCYIRGRPPVSTLYETILFITAVATLVALCMEWINRQGIGLLSAAIMGAGGMFLAMRYEAHDAVDTMPTLVAVLDTNFWLATHVTCITMGYGAGLLAAAIAHIWIIGKLFGLKANDPAFYRGVTKMVYGVICFSLLFSVVGTILGGIWANYSWGRFWGWDPKENGALMICLWQLAMVHGRLGGYLKHQGMCVAAIICGSVVAFSWWGVNLLSVGLHSYGFTTGVATVLFTFYGIEAVVLLASFAWWLGQRGGSAEAVTAEAPAEIAAEPAAEAAAEPPAEAAAEPPAEAAAEPAAEPAAEAATEASEPAADGTADAAEPGADADADAKPDSAG